MKPCARPVVPNAARLPNDSQLQRIPEVRPVRSIHQVVLRIRRSGENIRTLINRDPARPTLTRSHSSPPNPALHFPEIQSFLSCSEIWGRRQHSDGSAKRRSINAACFDRGSSVGTTLAALCLIGALPWGSWRLKRDPLRGFLPYTAQGSFYTSTTCRDHAWCFRRSFSLCTPDKDDSYGPA